MFPFLQRDDCPVKFKILLNEKMIAYNTVLKNRQMLIEDAKASFLSESDKLKLAKETVERFEEDQLIFDEFVHYHESREILGNHPIFKKERFKQEVKLMSGIEQMKAYKNLAPRISREKKKLKASKDPGKKQIITQHLKALEMQRQVLKEIMDSAFSR